MSQKKSLPVSERYKLSIPCGWYAVAYSSEIKANQTKPLSLLNKEYVLFRNAKGKAKVMEAYCPHQGTHLGHGGKIENNCIVCPFHRWQFDETGQCVEIPYAKRIPSLERNCIKVLPTVEDAGIIFIYYHPENAAPDFHLPEFEKELSLEEWTKPKQATFLMNTSIHEMGENGFDIAHFKPVHRSEKNSIDVKSDTTEKVMQYRLSVVYPGSGMGLPFTKINVTADWSYHGLGVFSTIISLDKFPTVIWQRYCFTPKNDGELIIRFTLRIKKASLPGNFIAKWLQEKLINFQNVRLVMRNFNEDRPIWENKIYRPQPVLCDGDGPILHYRRWAQQFYLENGLL